MKSDNSRSVYSPKARECIPIGFSKKGFHMANGSITRTVCTANAFAWQVDGSNEDGSPKMVRVGDVEFVSTAPNKTEAFHALKNAGFNVSSKFVCFEIIKKDVYCQSLEVFMEHAVVVDRAVNGRILNNVPEV